MKEQTQKRKAKILIVDDHPIVRYGISRILNKEEDLILLDISLKRFDGLKLSKIIRVDHPEIPVLILSMHDETVYARKALRSGAKGYIMKEESSEKLVPAVRQVLRGEIYVSDDVKKDVLTDFGTPKTELGKSFVDKLSDRERQIFILLGQGYSSRAIAEKLALSVKTIETHRSRIKLKLNIENNQQLLVTSAEWADDEGLKPSLTS